MREVLVSRTPGVFVSGPHSLCSSSALDGFSSALNITVSSLTGSGGGGNSSCCHTRPSSAVKRSREEGGEGGSEEEEEKRCCGRPATRLSPTRTLERVMAKQAARTAEESFFSFYLSVLAVFREVFGERYSLKHLGATNATRHDLPLVEEEEEEERVGAAQGDGRHPRKRLRYSTTLAEGTVVHRKESASARAFLHGDVQGSLESVFPRLRQNYSSASPSHVERTAGNAGDPLDPRRTPPLDVLLHYPTFVESLKEL